MHSNELSLYLSQFLTERRLNLINRVVSQRSRYLTVLLEDIFQSQNASAIVRSCECCGVQEVHVVEDTNPLRYNPLVLRGSDRWMEIFRHTSGLTTQQASEQASEQATQQGSQQGSGHAAEYALNHVSALDGAITTLRERGYRIVAATPDANGSDVEGFDLEAGPFALVFGNERRGVSARLIAQADAFVKIPMYGFTESFNVSVSAGILLSRFAFRLRASQLPWQLSEFETERLRLEWIKQSLRDPEGLIKRFYAERPPREVST